MRADVSVRPCPLSLRRNDIDAAIERLRQFGSADASHIVDQVPEEWIHTDERSALKTYLVDRAPKAAEVLAAAYPAKEADHAA